MSQRPSCACTQIDPARESEFGKMRNLRSDAPRQGYSDARFALAAKDGRHLTGVSRVRRDLESSSGVLPTSACPDFVCSEPVEEVEGLSPRVMLGAGHPEPPIAIRDPQIVAATCADGIGKWHVCSVDVLPC
jgi:hypothetical protein